MSLPVATVIRLLSKQGIEGCTGNIYESIENLGDFYMPATIKDMLLKPIVTNYAANVALLLPTLQSSTYTNLYRCDNYKNANCRKNVTNDSNTNCPSCYCYEMKHSVTFVNPTNKPSYSSEVGFVRGAATYMIMDDLVVRPMSTESIIALLGKFNVKDVGDLEVKIASVGAKEAVELLRALIWSKAELTDVFLRGKKKPSTKSEPSN
ncbi:hypothetical protein V6N11_070580 [Hibiscus sabdariffa]|uniref:DUF674 domain-containing protein n=1 Tax=Hibiscus sabdariffa TaxID=183260 RepID=A0ABR2QFF6_9ROSI